MTSCIINASNRREPANCSIKSFLYRTTFGNDHLQLAENTKNDWNSLVPSGSVTNLHLEKLNMRRNKMRKIALFLILAIKKVIGRWFQKRETWLIFQIWSGDREMVPKSGESRFMGESWQVWPSYGPWFMYKMCSPKYLPNKWLYFEKILLVLLSEVSAVVGHLGS